MNRFKVDWQENCTPRNHHDLLPKCFRALIIGKSNCGKTSLLMNMLLADNWLDYNRLYVVGNSLFQPKYDILKRGFDNGLTKAEIRKIFELENEIKEKGLNYKDAISLLGEEVNRPKKVQVYYYKPSHKLPDPESLDRRFKNLMVFDDLMDESQVTPKLYYTRGRHSNTDCFYISQNYFELDRKSIRSNADLLVLFRLPVKDLQHIFTDLASVDFENFKDFQDFCEACWRDDYSYVVIDLTSKPESGRKYRKSFEDFYIPEKFLSAYESHNVS